MRALPNGRLRKSGRAASILETDEAVVPQLVQVISPRVLVFTNLFRDQLDRYGEVDSVSLRWQQAISTLPSDTILILNADDPSTAYLGSLFSGRVLYFGIDDPHLDLTQQDGVERHQVMDARTCPRCSSEFTYTLRIYSHMGHYYCPNCGLTRPEPDLRALHVQTDDFDRMRVQVTTSILTTNTTKTQQQDIVVPLPGIYNIYNALAAAATAQALQISWGPIVTGIEQFKPIFGRGERVQVDGRTLRLLLAKNPTGFNEVLRTLFSEGAQRHILFVLNDNIADGRDISWIWDVDFERAVDQSATLVVAGSRALDLSLRLKYAGANQDDMVIIRPAPSRIARREMHSRNRNQRAIKNTINKARTSRKLASAKVVADAPADGSIATTQSHYGLAQALSEAIRRTPEGETLFVIPTYTGLLEIHRELEQRGLTPHYWEEKDW
jgi:UDP-N-acetylmuramyl tripeptide synthase